MTGTGLGAAAAESWGDGWPAAPDVLYALRGLGSASAVLHVGVHPDDEEVGMMAYLARGRGARTVYWSATRGEGGQNRLSQERAEALGVMRTWESLAARRCDGGEVLYGPFYDFGFAKTAQDTFVRWPRDELVREVARAIRLVQPLVVISRWAGDSNDGHGQHQAIGQVVRDAWDAAADPNALPELELPPWQARKLYRSLAGDWQPGEEATPGVSISEYEDAGHLRIDTGAVDVISGRSFQELGHLAVNQHRTQGFTFLPERGAYYYYYRLELSLGQPVGPDQGFFDNTEPRLRGLADVVPDAAPELRERLAIVEGRIDEAHGAFRVERPAPAGQALLEALDALHGATELLAAVHDDGARAALGLYLDRRSVDLADVAARCLGLRLECVLDRFRVTSGDHIRARSRVWSDGTVEAETTGIELELPDRWSAEKLPVLAQAGTVGGADHEITVGGPRWAASPYWLREPRRPYRYVWPRRGPLSLAFDPPLVHASADVIVNGHALTLRVPAHHLRAVPGGVGSLPLVVVPAIALEPRARRLQLPLSRVERRLKLPVLVRCLRERGQEAKVALACPRGWTADPVATDVTFTHADDSRTVTFTVTVPPGAEAGTHTLRYLVASGGAPYGVELEPVRLGLGAEPHEGNFIAETFVSRPSAVTVHLVDVTFVPGRRYAYLVGLDEAILSALSGFGLDITVLDEDELAFTDLTAYDAVIVGPNAYNARPAVRGNAARLLDYVHGGGTLIVQYQTYGYDETGLAPYPFSYHQPHDRVTLSEAPVKAVAPEHPVLNAPNAIGDSDWEGWVHDRGMYFFGTWDARYTPVLASADLGEEPRLGGLMVAEHGRGTYVYVGYSLHRQIPAGVPGGIRLLANLMALGGGTPA